MRNPCHKALADTTCAKSIAYEESILDDQYAIAEEEERIFELRTEQLDRYLQDRILVLKQKYLVESRSLVDLDRRCKSAISPSALRKFNNEKEKTGQELNRIDQEIAGLRNGTEPNYQAWRTSLLERRSQPPEVTIIVDVNFQVVAESGK